MSKIEKINERDIKLECFILRAIVDIKNQHYESAEEQLMEVRKILENIELENI